MKKTIHMKHIEELVTVQFQETAQQGGFFLIDEFFAYLSSSGILICDFMSVLLRGGVPICFWNLVDAYAS